MSAIIHCHLDKEELMVEIHKNHSISDVMSQFRKHVPPEKGDILKLYSSNGALIPIGPNIPKNSKEKSYRLVLSKSSSDSNKDVEIISKKLNHLGKFLKSNFRTSNIVLKPAVIKANAVIASLSPFTSQTPRYEIEKDVYDRLSLCSFEVWEFEDHQLRHFIFHIFKSLNLLAHFKIDASIMNNFLLAVEKCYNNNPFHNFKHAFCVTQMTYVLLSLGETPLISKLSMIEVFSVLLAAIGHDLDHPGYNNAYQINAQTELAIAYNDNSPLENHHCALLFALLQHSETNILANLPLADYREIRKIVISCILATDMGKHADCMNKIRECNTNFNFEDPAHRSMLIQFVLKCADISNEVRPTSVSERWADCLLKEFFMQSDKEKQENLPFAPFMDREKVTKSNAQGNILNVKFEVGFIGFVLLPLFEETFKILPQMDPLITNIKRSREFYSSMARK